MRSLLIIFWFQLIGFISHRQNITAQLHAINDLCLNMQPYPFRYFSNHKVTRLATSRTPYIQYSILLLSLSKAAVNNSSDKKLENSASVLVSLFHFNNYSIPLMAKSSKCRTHSLSVQKTRLNQKKSRPNQEQKPAIPSIVQFSCGVRPAHVHMYKQSQAPK